MDEWTDKCFSATSWRDDPVGKPPVAKNSEKTEAGHPKLNRRPLFNEAVGFAQKLLAERGHFNTLKRGRLLSFGMFCFFGFSQASRCWVFVDFTFF